jgi:hypothetical protein
VIAVGNEPQRQRETREHQRPRVQVGDRAAAGEADPRHAVVEVLAVGTVDRLLVLEPLEHHEGRVEERHGEQDQRQHERHHGGSLDSRLYGDHAHQQAEQVGAAVAHEARGRREVEEQEAERRAGGQRSEHTGLRAAEIECDHGHRGGDDHANAGREPVDAVGEVDDVHHQHEPDDGEHGASVRHAGVGEGEFADERQRDRLDGHPEMHDYHRGQHLTGELDGGAQVEAVVERPDDGYDGRAEQHPVPQLMFLEVPGRQRHECGDERAGEDRQAAEQRRRLVGEPALAWLVDRADAPREAHAQGRQQRGHPRGEEEGVKRFELGWMRHRLATASQERWSQGTTANAPAWPGPTIAAATRSAARAAAPQTTAGALRLSYSG